MSYNSEQNTSHAEELDIKELLFKLLAHWRLFVIAIVVTFFVAWLVNRYSTKIYELSTLINIKESENPLAGSSVNLMFKWGGASELIQSHIAILKSRSHNTKVIKRLNLEVEYYSTGRIKMFTRYGQSPFHVVFDKNHNQILNLPLSITFLDGGTSFDLTYEPVESFNVVNYNEGSKSSIQHFGISGNYDINEWIETEICKFKIIKEIDESKVIVNENWFFKFSNPKSLVDGYTSSITVDEESEGGSLLNVSMTGDNKEKIVAYLNTSIDILAEYELAEKNKLAENTIRFVDMQMQGVVDTLKAVENELQKFRVDNQVMDLSSQANDLYSQFLVLEQEKSALILEEKYYTYLLDYLKKGDDFSSLMTPSVVGVEDPVLITLVSNLVGLSVQRNRMLYSLQTENPALEQIRSEIKLTRNSLRENVANLITAIAIEQDELKGRISQMRSKLSTLPGTEQSLINIRRKYELSSLQYNFLIEKRAEAELSMAGNLPDVQVVDPAEDYFDRPLKPKKNLNYLIGILIGMLIPAAYVFAKDFLNTKIASRKELEKITNIPIIGTIGHSTGASNIVIQNGMKSAVAESFRIIRTNLKFMFKQDEASGISSSKILVVTSSIGGEGKTFCAINLASIISISGSKTVIIGLDMRKPKIFNDFKLSNEVGMSDYLSGQVGSDKIISQTPIDNLDFITAGPVPPNPSELLLSERLPVLLAELKEQYDYIILDTPPIALVSDALELMKYADGTLYLTRQNYTPKDLLSIINEQYHSKNIKNISIVFNDIVHTAYGYGYNYGYSYGYNYGYGYGYYDEADVKKPWWKRIV
jgi:capsular exopolysaccharide synthesis family protein